MLRSLAAATASLIVLALPALADDVPKRGGILTFVIPADAPPSFDGHRNVTFATIHAVDTQVHEIFLLWRYRIVPYRSYVKGWKISPSHYVNQNLATIWLDK